MIQFYVITDPCAILCHKNKPGCSAHPGLLLFVCLAAVVLHKLIRRSLENGVRRRSIRLASRFKFLRVVLPHLAPQRRHVFPDVFIVRSPFRVSECHWSTPLPGDMMLLLYYMMHGYAMYKLYKLHGSTLCAFTN